MGEALAFGSLTFAVLGAGCCARRRPDWLVVTGLTVMVLGMLDTMALGARLLSPLMWTLVLIGCAACLGIARFREPLGLERAGHVAAMALLTGAMAVVHSRAHGAVTDMASMHDMPEMAHGGQHTMPSAATGTSGVLLLLVCLVLACGWAVFEGARSVRSSGLLRVERTAGALSIVGMALMVVVM